MQTLIKPKYITRTETFLVKDECKPLMQEVRVISEADKKSLQEKLDKCKAEFLDKL